jgi:hypothetical protein
VNVDKFNRVLFKICLSLFLGLITGVLIYLGEQKIYKILFFNKTYIALMNTPTYKNYTKLILEEFNSYGNNKIIHFESINKGRPVTISEMSDEEEQDKTEVLGYSIPLARSCSITIRKYLRYEVYREVLLHEYLHCMGYEHVKDESDLMYYALNYLDKEYSIRQYANRLLNTYYE